MAGDLRSSPEVLNGEAVATAAPIVDVRQVPVAAAGSAAEPECEVKDGSTGRVAEDARPPRPLKRDPDRARLCIVTRAELSPDAMVRFVLGPDDAIVPDIGRRLPGRGVWVTATRDAVGEAIKRNLFAKSLKKSVKVDKDLADQIEKLFTTEARQALSLANKAGLVSIGFSKVEIALERNAAVALITANDASVDGAGKLARKFKAIRSAAGQNAPIIQEFSSAELNLATGGSNVVHVALAGGGLGRRVITCCRRLRHFRMRPDEHDTDGSDVEATP